jgi:hypothetical protein
MRHAAAAADHRVDRRDDAARGALAAGMRSGMARLKAPKIRLRSLAQVRLRMPTAAGKDGFSTVPSGAMQVKGRVRPELSRSCGFSV